MGPKAPTQAHITIESPMAGPAIAALIGRVLLEAGAEVSLDPKLGPLPDKTKNLLGLQIHIGRTIWVRQEEADRTFHPQREDWNPEKEARRQWDSTADEYNKWENLGDDEKTELIESLASKKAETVVCEFCHELVPAKTAHLHQGKWVGDECCWDERLRASE